MRIFQNKKTGMNSPYSSVFMLDAWICLWISIPVLCVFKVKHEQDMMGACGDSGLWENREEKQVVWQVWPKRKKIHFSHLSIPGEKKRLWHSFLKNITHKTLTFVVVYDVLRYNIREPLWEIRLLQQQILTIYKQNRALSDHFNI